jgi:hypothetical protein
MSVSPKASLPRWSLALCCAVVAAIFIWAAVMLPWREWTLFSIVTTAVGAMHAITCVLALAGHRARARAWRVQAFVSLTYLGYLTYNLATASSYIAELYGGLGRGVAAALGLVWVIVFALTVPLSAWGLAVTGGVRLTGKGKAGGAAAIVLLVVGVWRSTEAAAAEPILAWDDDAEIETIIAAALPESLPATMGAAPSLMTSEPAVCDEPPASGRSTIVATFVTGRVAPVAVTRCVQGASLGEAADALKDVLARDAVRGRIAIDVITARQDLAHVVPVVDALTVRPALDGVCEGNRCLMPWQMTALELFNSTKPIPVIPDLRFGIDPVHLRRLLAPPGASGLIPAGLDGLTRIETKSFATDADGRLHELRRLRRKGPDLTPENLDAAVLAAERYILSAQGPDGRFEYNLSPFTGVVSYRGFSLARQAGTTLVVCELSRDRERAKQVATAALAMLGSTQRHHGDMSMLYYPREKPVTQVGLGDTALSSIAFLSCRDLVGPRFDDTIDRMTRFLLAMQRPNGSFYPAFDLEQGEPIPGPDPLYAVGQAVFALTLLEKVTADDPGKFAEHARIRDAVEAAMTYIATDYWSGFATDFFYMEENWHCLAARASLRHHRHDGYEQFCVDYVSYKQRLILDEHDRVDPDFVGGYGFGNVLVPHNTGSAGFGEAGSAALAIKRERGEDTTDLERSLELVLRFLLHHQWDDVSCFACTSTHPIVGGFSEHMASPVIRIDYVQHAMAGMGHTGRMFGWVDGQSY